MTVGLITVVPALEIYRGDTFSRRFTFQDSAENPVNLLDFGDEWTAQLRKSEDFTEAINFSVDTTDAATGVLVLNLTATDTADIPSKGVWDCQVVNTAVDPPAVKTILRGTFTRIKDVTRP
jgi:hypothetical protein